MYLLSFKIYQTEVMAGQIIDKTNRKISVINFFLKKVKCTKHTCSENKKQCILTKVLHITYLHYKI